MLKFERVQDFLSIDSQMDGSTRTYGNAFAGGYSRTPDATGGDRFKTNVNRSKTRKWLEAKVQSYNGDDWGTDYDEELRAESYDSYADPSPMARPLASRQSDQPLLAAACTEYQPSVDSLNDVVSQGQPPPPHVQNPQLPFSSYPSGGDPATAPSQCQGSRRDIHESVVPVRGPHSSARSSDVCSSDQPYGGGPMSANFPLRKSSLESAEPIRHPTSSQPVSGDKAWLEPRSPANAIPFIRPADIYRRMSEEVDRERRSVDSGPNSIDCQSQVFEQAPKDLAQSEVVQRDPQRKSEYGLDGLLASYVDEDAAELGERPPITKLDTSQQVSEQDKTVSERQSVSSDNSDQAKVISPRFSRSPQLPELPDLSRTSGFGAGFGDDFFSGPSGFATDLLPPTLTRETPSPSPSPPTKNLVGESVKKPDSRANMSSILPPPSLERGTARESAEARPRTPVVTPSALDTLKGSLEGATQLSSPSASGKVHSLVQAINSRSASPERHPHALPSTPLQATNDLQVTVDSSASPSTGIPGAAGDGLEKTPLPEANQTITTEPGNTSDGPEEEGGGLGTDEKELRKDALSKGETTPVMLKPSEETQSLKPSQIGGPLHLAVSVPTSQAGQETATRDSTSNSVQSEILPTAPLNTRKSAAAPDIKDEPMTPSFITRQSTIDTATSSPAKESDVLREEIIKSLSPVHGSSEISVRSRKRSVDSSSAKSPVRESSYLPDLYDDYWSSGEAKADQGAGAQEEGVRIPEFPGIPNGAKEQRPLGYSEEDAPASQSAKLAASAFAVPHLQNIEREPEKAQTRSSSASGSRRASRRFSWQEGGEQVNISGHDDDDDDDDDDEEEDKEEEEEEEVVEPPKSGSHRPDPGVFEPTPVVLEADNPSGGTAGPNDLQATTSGDAGTMPSPLSDKMASSPEVTGLFRSQEANMPSLVPLSAETQARTPSPPTVQRTTTRTTMNEAPVLAFKEIMNFSLSEDRRRAFNETRAHFGGSDVGLIEWMIAMRSQHAEYANMSSSFASAIASSSTAGPGGDQPGAHGLGYSTHGSSLHFMPPPYLHGVNFQHTSQQVGTKSKELLMAAGKAGKGLLSKGKNKLRVTGDRVFS